MGNASISMVATARQTYNGRALKTGDVFDVKSEVDAADLVAVRMAVRAVKPAPAQPIRVAVSPAPYEVKVMEPEETGATPSDIVTPTEQDNTTSEKDKYHRRDMGRGKR